MPTIFQAIQVAQIAPWGRFDCMGGCCNYLSWTSVGPQTLCAHKVNLEVATLRGIPSRLEASELCKLTPNGKGPPRGGIFSALPPRRAGRSSYLFHHRKGSGARSAHQLSVNGLQAAVSAQVSARLNAANSIKALMAKKGLDAAKAPILRRLLEERLESSLEAERLDWLVHVWNGTAIGAAGLSSVAGLLQGP